MLWTLPYSLGQNSISVSLQDVREPVTLKWNNGLKWVKNFGPKHFCFIAAEDIWEARLYFHSKHRYTCLNTKKEKEKNIFSDPANTYLFKVNNRNTIAVNFEHVSKFLLVFLLLTWNKQMLAGNSLAQKVPLTWSLNDSCFHHIETSLMICSANQLFGFSMMWTLLIRRLMALNLKKYCKKIYHRTFNTTVTMILRHKIWFLISLCWLGFFDCRIVCAILHLLQWLLKC